MPSIPGAVHAGGLWCDQVLEHLDAYVDGSLSEQLRQAAEAHLAQCDQCTRFGGAYAHLVQCLRDKLAAAPPVDPEVARRLEAHLERALEDR